MTDKLEQVAVAGAVALADEELDKVSGGPTAVEYAVMLAYAPADGPAPGNVPKHQLSYKLAE